MPAFSRLLPSSPNSDGANDYFTITICPENDAQVIELDFQSFTTQPVQNGNGDGLIIYNGDSTSAEEFGMFSGTSASSSPGFIVADNPSGCLTIQFFSNGAAQASGWEAIISCFEPCQDVTAAIDSNPGVNIDGSIDFINGNRMLLSESIYNHQPKVGDMILFPHYLMHTAYPFKSNGERRSFSFNLEIDKKIANVFTR